MEVHVFEEHQGIINRCIRRNYPLIAAMRLDLDDVRQDLSIRMYRALMRYDAERSVPLSAYLYIQLQYEILSIRRRHRPLGMAGVPNDDRPKALYLDQPNENGTYNEIPTYDHYFQSDEADACQGEWTYEYA